MSLIATDSVVDQVCCRGRKVEPAPARIAVVVPLHTVPADEVALQGSVRAADKDATTGTGEFMDLPDRIYYKIDSTTQTIDIVGKYRRLTGAPAGYTPKDWLLALWDDDANAPDARIETNWRGYDRYGTKPVRYIYPLPQAVIINSNGMLKNDGYDFPGF